MSADLKKQIKATANKLACLSYYQSLQNWFELWGGRVWGLGFRVLYLVMEDIGLVKQGWNWLQSQKHLCSWVCAAMQCFGGKTEAFVERHWPLVCSGCGKLLGLLSLSFSYWKDCVLRGFQSSARFGSAALLLIMWSCFLSLTSISCLVYVLLGMVRPS